MKLGAVVVGVIGFVFAFLTAIYLRTGFTGPALFGPAANSNLIYYLGTIGVAAVGLLSAILVYWTPRLSAWLAGLVTVVGIFTSGTLWLGAGSFFFVVFALAFSISRDKLNR